MRRTSLTRGRGWGSPASGGAWGPASAGPAAPAAVVPALALQVYRSLVWLYPPAFRRQFAFEMACDFGDATCEAWREGRWLAVLPLWIRLGHDFAWTMAVQWLRHGLPVVSTLSALGMTMFLFALAGALLTPLRPLTFVPNDDGLMLLLFLATVVLLIAAAVIVFTVCFWLLVVRKNERARRV